MEAIITRFTFTDYPKEIQLSKAQRPKYFEYNGRTIKSKSKKLWKKCIKPEFKDEKNIKPHQLKSPYVLVRIKGDKIIGMYGKVSSFNYVKTHLKQIIEYDTSNLSKTDSKKKAKDVVYNVETKELVCSNPTQVGKPKMHKIKGQDFYVGLNEYIRVKIVDELKAYYHKEIELQNIPVIDDFPIKVRLTIYDTLDNTAENSKVEGSKWDVGNKGLPYMKVFSDFISRDNGNIKRLIPDDEKSYIYAEEIKYIPITKEETSKLTFDLIYDDNVAKAYKTVEEWRKEKFQKQSIQLNLKL